MAAVAAAAAAAVAVAVAAAAVVAAVVVAAVDDWDPHETSLLELYTAVLRFKLTATTSLSLILNLRFDYSPAPSKCRAVLQGAGML